MGDMITITDISKKYRLYRKNTDRLKEAVSIIRKKYHEDFYALKDINFTVKKGETLGILGKNGSGKSTLLKIITGVLTPSSGEVVIHGKVAALLELGAGFNPEYTGIENIKLNGLLMGRTSEEMEERMQDILEFADIGDFIFQPVKNYSSGMFARLAFAVAINVEPEILIIDEALSVGDVFFQQKCFERIKMMKSEGVTILFVSHDVTSISTLCDRCVLLNEGEIFSEGEPRIIINDYVRLYSEGNENFTKVKKERYEDISINSDNPEEYRYGDLSAEIIEVQCMDEMNKESNWIVYTLDDFKIRIKILFYEDCINPVLGFYIKNKKGLEMYSGNTHYMNKNIGSALKGQIVEVTFTQKMVLAPDEYILSFGLSDYHEGVSRPLDRRYDLYKLIVKSERTIIGMFDLNSEIEIVKGED